MKFETPMYSDGIVKSKQTVFGGLNHNPGAGDGQIYEMRNMCSDYYPLLATRPRRNLHQASPSDPHGIFCDERTVMSGSIQTTEYAVYTEAGGKLYRATTELGSVGSGSSRGKCYFAKLNNFIVLFPNKMYYNPETQELGSLESEVLVPGGSPTKVYNSYDTTVVVDSTHIKMTLSSFITGVTPPTVGTEVIKKYWYSWLDRHDIPHSKLVEQWTGQVTAVADDEYTIEILSGDIYPIKSYPAVIELWTSATSRTFKFQDGTIYGEPAVQNTIYCADIDWDDYFNVGDAVTISGSAITENNKTIIVREIDEHELRFYEYSFTNGTETSQDFSVKREVPDMDGIFESGSRLWGWKNKTIYASKLGDPFNFNVFDGLESDSWAVEIGGVGNVTAGIEYQGYPIFFREWGLFKVYGYMPSNFELIRTAETGVKAGCGKSLAIAGETLFYYNRNGVYAYAGGLPTKISAALGVTEYYECIGGSDGQKYYMSGRVGNKWHLLVYDTLTGLWHEEDDMCASGFGRSSNMFLAAGTLKTAKKYGNTSRTGGVFIIAPRTTTGYSVEEEPDWFVEFTDFTDDSPNKKDFKRLQIRLELDEDTADPPWVKAKLMMDSDGEWIEPEGGTIEDPEKRSYLMTIIPRRADHYRLRLEGHGGCRIYSIAREFSEGSDLKSVKGRQ